jgi:dephospho-CoA kinase
MITLGVTGGLGSGKSTACDMFAELGVPVFVADEVAKELMVSHDGLRRDLVGAFGAEAYMPDGSLNRKHLATRVFGDPARLERINALVHPRVFEAFQSFLMEAEQEGAPMAIKEAAILFESGGDSHVDETLVVDALISTRIERVMKRDGMSAQDAMERIRHQLPSEELRERAGFVIDNDGDLNDLRTEVRRVYETLTSGRNDV